MDRKEAVEQLRWCRDSGSLAELCDILVALLEAAVGKERPSKAKFDRVKYQREYMRKRRLKMKSPPSSEGGV